MTNKQREQINAISKAIPIIMGQVDLLTRDLIDLAAQLNEIKSHPALSPMGK